MKTFVAVGFSLALLLVPATQLAAAAESSSRSASSRPNLAYHWPIKPFNSPHPIRGAFGDPRLVSNGMPFGWTGPNESAAHSFHNGIDIVAATGTPVYPVVSGWVARANSGQIVINTYDGRAFQYYHLDKAQAVRPGRRVVAYHTVLGRIRSTYQHVHLAEIDNHVVHNPLAPGHLEPYRDTTRPAAADLYVADGPVPSPVSGRSIGRGDILAVAAADPPAMTLPGEWSGSAQIPALVEWRLFHGNSRTAWKVAVDFRKTLPPVRDFWQIYGSGTYQNSPTFNHIYHGMAGRYLFRLHIHPDRLSRGAYKLAVRVSDVRGNRSTSWWPLQIVR
jgi:murein DD-endopeptidase MepM/ murein hydrolase activator NlpD